MKARLFLVFSIAATMLWSCQFDDVLSTPSNEGVIMVTSSSTRAESTGETNESTTNDNFKDGEIIYVWADKNGNTDGYIKAWELTATGTNGGFIGNSKTWPYDGSSLDFHALHGNFTEGDLNNNWSALTSLKHTVLDDQSSDENRRKSDLLYAAKTGATHGNNVELSFEHLLAKITVKLDLNNSMGITKEDFENASVSILGIKPEAYFKSSSKDASTSGGSTIDINAGAIDKPTDLISEAYYAGSAIVPLQTIAANSSLIKIKLKDRIFIYKASEETTFQKGQEYTYTLIIRGKQITGTLSVSDFTPDEDKNILFKDKLDYLADLKNRSYLGSAENPHDLSCDYNGQMNTANCYVVTHPGYYKFPIVYGNAIKNGATNAIAYGVGTGSSTFVNHLGNQISDPYIYNNSGCTVGSASLVWQDAPNLISNNIALCDDNKYIKFAITKENIQQGNAVIAVKDGAGTIMWSWHIWVTNKNVYETQAVTASYQGTTQTFMFMPFPLGWNDSNTTPTCTFYQWGRKDPLPPSNGSNSDITLYGYETTNPTMNNLATTDINISIQNPLTFYGAGTNSWENTGASDLWNVGNELTDVNFNTVTKSVYDPSPAGFHLPCPAAFTGFTSDGNRQNTSANINGGWDSTKGGWTFNTTGGDATYWQACGYRHSYIGSLYSVGTWGYYWSAGPGETENAWSLAFFSNEVFPQWKINRTQGCSVRPVSE